MGFYSFYKILKDMIQTLFGRNIFKILIILILISILLFVLDRNHVFASQDISFVSPYSDTPFTFSVPDNNYYFFSVNKYNNYYYFVLMYSDSEFLYQYNDGMTNKYRFYFNDTTKHLIANVGTTVFSLEGVQSRLNTSSNYIDFGYQIIPNMNCLNFDYYICNFDIKNSNGDVLFSDNASIPQNPEILTSSADISTLLFDVLRINAKDYSQEDLYLLCYDKNFENTDSLNNLYPVNTFLLNQNSRFFIPERTENIDNAAIYWINRDEIGFNWAIGNTYSFRFAIRAPIENDFSNWEYQYLGEEITFTISSNVLQSQIDDLNAQTKEKEEQLRHQEIINSIDRQTDQDNYFYNSILSDQYDQDQPGDSLNGISDTTSTVDNSQYIGLFSAVFGKFSNIINGNYNNVETISYPMMNTNESIVVSSDLLSSKIQGSFIYTFLQLFWYFLFGMYIFKFSNNLIRSIKSGSILNGYENNNEVITSTML